MANENIFTDNGRKRRRRRGSGGRILFVILILIVAGAGWGVWNVFGTSLRPKGAKTTEVRVSRAKPKKSAKTTVIAQRTFVVLGVSENGDEKSLVGAAQVVFDPAQNRIAGLYVDPKTFAFVPGRGLLSLADGFSEGPKRIAPIVSELIGIKAEGYLVVGEADFAVLKETKDVPALFSRYNDGNVSRSELKALAARMKVIPVDRRNLYDLPVRDFTIGDTTYFNPVKDELKGLVEAIWQRPREKKRADVKVIILNGNGVPGIGRKAADRLSAEKVTIVDVKNADKFDYEATALIAYTQKGRKATKDMADALGVGETRSEPMAQDVADVVVILGGDFK